MPMPEMIVTVPNNKITLQDSIEEAKISGKFTELIQGFLRRQIIAQQAQQRLFDFPPRCSAAFDRRCAALRVSCSDNDGNWKNTERS